MLLAAVRRSLPDADVLVVDDNSPDGTADAGRGGGVRAGPDQAAAAAGQAGARQRLPQRLRHRPRRGLRRRRLDGRRLLPRSGRAARDARPDRRRRRRRDRVALRARRRHRRLAAGTAACCRAGATATRRWCSACRSATARPASAPTAAGALRGDRPADDDGRGLRLPHRARAPPRPRRVPRDGDADRVRRPPARPVEDVRPHRRRVDAAGHPLGSARCASWRASRRRAERRPSRDQRNHSPTAE